VFSQPEHAAGELRSLLPAEVARRIDWSTLQLLSESFIGPRLGELRADLVFSVKLDGRAAYFYVLLEHQSTTDRRMPLRMLRYMIQIWDAHLRAHADALLLPSFRRGPPQRRLDGAGCVFELAGLPSDLRASLGAALAELRLFARRRLGGAGRSLFSGAEHHDARIALFCSGKKRGRAATSERNSPLERCAVGAGSSRGSERSRGALDGRELYSRGHRHAARSTRTKMLSQLGPKAEEYVHDGDRCWWKNIAPEWLAQGRAGDAARQLSVKFGPFSAEVEQRVRNAEILGSTFGERVLRRAGDRTTHSFER
jgi:hypothetical protein